MSKVVIEVKTARLSRDTDTWSKMDPYVVLISGSEKKKTKTHNKGGKNPMWNESLTLKYVDTNMTIQVWDEDITSDDLVGGGVIDLEAAARLGGLKDWITIQYKGKEVGQIYVEISFTTPTATAPASAYAAYTPATTPPSTHYAAPTAPYPPTGYPATSPGVYAPAPAPIPAYPAGGYSTPSYTPSAATHGPSPSAPAGGMQHAPPAGAAYAPAPGAYPAPGPAPTHPPGSYPPGSW
ncbi:unnamed protein product [Moneuplotes crassus]|uniref:C2 domain-containing protein n=1 Tax=Euplotes crassus TaxID=5936 RepID=A0AAD1XR17_EUPCR|nr:unnamed protein product [Moneuplotes crassus]